MRCKDGILRENLVDKPVFMYIRLLHSFQSDGAGEGHDLNMESVILQDMTDGDDRFSEVAIGGNMRNACGDR